MELGHTLTRAMFLCRLAFLAPASSRGEFPEADRTAINLEADDLFSYAQSEQRHGNLAVATRIYSQLAAVGEENVASQIPESLRRRAQEQLHAIQGIGGFTVARAEFLADTFVDQVMDPAALGAMTGAGLTYRLARFGLLNTAARLGIRSHWVAPVASLLAFAAEASLFPVYGRFGNMVLHREVDWDSEQILHDVQGSFLVLGGLKLFGAVGNRGLHQWLQRGRSGGALTQSVLSTLVPQAAMYLGIMSGYQAEQSLGLRETTSFGQVLLESLATLIHFNAMGRLVPVLGGRQLRNLEAGLDEAIHDPISASWFRLHPVFKNNVQWGVGSLLLGQELLHWFTPDRAHAAVEGLLHTSGQGAQLLSLLGLLTLGGLAMARGRARNCSDQELAAALERHGGNRTRTGQELRMNRDEISRKISEAGEDSPLHPFKEIRGRGWKRVGFSDDQIAKVLARHNGNRRCSARELEISRPTLIKRIQDAEQSSPLYPFKTVTGSRAIVSEQRLAEMLERHGGNRTLVARELQVTASSISLRISRSRKGSPLHPFKRLKGNRYRQSQATEGAPQSATGQKTKIRLNVQTLLAVELLANPGSAEELIDRILRHSEGNIPIPRGTLYPAMARLVREGYVRTQESPRNGNIGATKKPYELTEQGRTYARDAQQTLEKVFSRNFSREEVSQMSNLPGEASNGQLDYLRWLGVEIP